MSQSDVFDVLNESGRWLDGDQILKLVNKKRGNFPIAKNTLMQNIYRLVKTGLIKSKVKYKDVPLNMERPVVKYRVKIRCPNCARMIEKILDSSRLKKEKYTKKIRTKRRQRYNVYKKT